MKKKIDTLRIPYKYGDTIRIKTIADVHSGSKNCDMKKFIEYLGKPDKNTYLLGLGDMMDCIIVSDAKRYSKSNDGSESDDIIGESVQQWIDILTPWRDKIIGLGIGNHEETMLRRCSINPVKMICDRLGVNYFGYSFLARLILHENNSRSRTVIIRGHHGWGGGSRTQGADLSKYSRDVAQFSADIFLYGHVHRLQYDTIPRLGICGDTLTAKDKHMAICGTFLRTYSSTTDSTYSECAGYPPARIGGPVISIKPTNSWVDINVSI
jgi:UDP-2,3-diacylglucosamine pyrophosphatase LpxH